MRAESGAGFASKKFIPPGDAKRIIGFAMKRKPSADFCGYWKRSRPCDALARLGVRSVPPCSAFSLAPALGSTGSSAGCPASFARFTATVAGSDSSPSCIAGFGSSPSRRGPLDSRAAKVEVSRFPVEERTYMPGPSTTQDRTCARVGAHPRFAFRS